MRLFAAIWKDYDESGVKFVESVDVTESVRFGTQLNGGFAGCSFSVGGQRDKSFYRYRTYLGGHVVVFDLHGRRIYEGFILKTAISETGVEVDVTGYFAKAQSVLDGRIYQDINTKLSQVVHDAITLVPAWNQVFAFISDADYTLGPLDFTDDTKVSDSLNKVLKFGYRDDDIRPIYFAIWQERMPFLFPEPKPDKFPNWFVSVSSIVGGQAGISLSLQNIYNKVYVRYDDSADDSTGPTLYPTPAESTLSQYRYGVQEGVVKAGQYGLEVGLDLRDMALEKFKFPRQVFTASVSGYVRHSAGYFDYPYRIRAGDTVLLTDLDVITAHSGTLAGQAAHGLSGFILKTEYDAASNTCRIDFGASDQAFEILMSRLGLSGGLG